MRTSARIAGVAGISVSMLAMASPAFADSAGNEGVNALNDNNISAVPVQLCGNNVGALVGVVVPLASPQTNECTNAPVVDHPSSEG